MSKFIAVLFSVVALGFGYYLEFERQNQHFTRSGALLVVIALFLAAYRERGAKKAEAEYLSDMFTVVTDLAKIGNVKLRAKIGKLQVDIHSTTISAGMRQLDQAKARSTLTDK